MIKYTLYFFSAVITFYFLGNAPAYSPRETMFMTAALVTLVLSNVWRFFCLAVAPNVVLRIWKPDHPLSFLNFQLFAIALSTGYYLILLSSAYDIIHFWAKIQFKELLEEHPGKLISYSRFAPWNAVYK